MATVKIIELIGSSPASWQDAVETALKEASKTIRDIKGLDVVNQTAVVRNGVIEEYRVDLKLSFLVDESREEA
ncbi:MAG TPA: dodecin family protein [Acidobacteriota bacterium]|nr:dodecin family protein [Acidobacteriota bacterium]